MAPRSSRPASARRRGSVTLETAIVLVPLLTLLLGIFEYARYLLINNLIENACREGARYAVVHTYDKTTADVQAVARGMLAGQDASLSGLSIQVYKVDPSTGANLGLWTDAKFGDAITLRVTGNYTPVVPRLLMMGSTIPIDIQSAMLSEAN